MEVLGGRGVLTVKILEAKYEAKLEFPGEGGGGGVQNKNLPWESMDIFWNNLYIIQFLRFKFGTRNAQPN